MSTISIAEKGRSTSSRTRHISIRYFFVKDRIDSGEVEVVYLPTEDMKADILTKPLQGELFRRMRAELLGHNIEENAIAKSMNESKSVGTKGCAEDTGTCLVAYSDLLWLGA
jgi:hypothetical protein